MKNYRRRIMDTLLEKKLQAKGAVLIEGPKWCGKTTTAEEIATSKIMLAKPDIKEHFKSLLEIDTDAALAGETPMLIDECNSLRWTGAPGSAPRRPSGNSRSHAAHPRCRCWHG